MLASILWLLALPVLAALAIYALELGLGLRPLTCGAEPASAGSVAVLVPAHDEAGGIARTLAALEAEITPGTRVLVVADNCSDRTAEIARNAGAEVIEREDADRRGKGFALAHGRAHLAANPPDMVIVLDADCAFRPGALAALLAATRGDRPAQALYLLEPDLAATPLVQISNFAFVVKNLVRDRGLSRLGGTSTLTGTGMALPWPIFAAAPLATPNIVEDLGLSIALVKAGVKIRLADHAEVRSAAAIEADTQGQRRRWEHGYLETALRHAPPLIWRGLTRRSRACLALGLHLLVPPLALLVLVSGLLVAACAVVEATTGDPTPLLPLAVVGTLAAGLTIVTWIREGRPWLAASHLLRTPLYIAWKIPLYARFLLARETTWIRTRRDGEV